MAEENEVNSDWFSAKFTEQLKAAGELTEQPTEPNAKQRLGLAYAILAGCAVGLVLAGVAVLAVPESKQEQADSIFEFSKTVFPPIITLVIGFYFNRIETRQQTLSSSDEE